MKVRTLTWLSAISLSLVAIPSQAATFGHNLSVAQTSSGSLIGTNTSRAWSARFTAKETITVDRAHMLVSFMSGPAEWSLRVQADDGGGDPDGTDLGTASLVGGPIGWNNAPLDVPVNLVAGNVYHFIYGATDITNGLPGVRRADGASILSHPSDGTPESNHTILFTSNSGGSWDGGSPNRALMYALTNSGTGDAVGQLYESGSGPATVGQTQGQTVNVWRGQSFTYTDPTAIINSISMRVGKTKASAADDLRLHLIDGTTNAVIAVGDLLDQNDPTGEGFATLDLTGLGHVINNGQDYILALESTGSDGAYNTRSNIANGGASGGLIEADVLALNFQGNGKESIVAESAGQPALADWLPSIGLVSDAELDNYFLIDYTVPEPASVLLIGAGALLLGRGRRRSA